MFKKILVLTYWSFKDALIHTYTLPYIRIIRKIFPANQKIYFVTAEHEKFRQSAVEKRTNEENLEKENIDWISFTYSRFGWLAVFRRIFDLLQLLWICRTKKIDCIHTWCTPAGMTGYLLSKFTGIPLVIDSYEPHAEAMIENGTWKKDGWAFKILFFFEKKMSKHASLVIAASNGMKEYALEKYGVVLKDFYVKPACVDLEIFSPASLKDAALLKQLHLEEKIICVYAGKIGGIYLEQEIFDFFKTAYNYWGDKFRALLLTDASLEKITQMITQSNFSSEIIINEFVQHKDIARYLGLADFALNPVKPVPTKRYCTSIKDGEYWAMGLPVVITKNISDDSEIIENNEIGAVLEEFSEEGYLKAIKKIDSLLKQDKKELRQKIINIAKKYRNFEIAEKIYQKIYTVQK